MSATAKKTRVGLFGEWRRVVLGLTLVVTLDVSVQEFAELLTLSDDARRARFDLPQDCTPIIGAVRPAAPNSGRLTVVVDCRRSTEIPASSLQRASWRDE